MKWSPQQEAALRDVDRWLRDPSDKLYRLFGYAGTGKTTLAKHLAQSIPLAKLRFAAFTGKAAYVLQQKGCPNATTIHSLIYIPKGKSGERLRKMQELLVTMELDDKRRPMLVREIATEEEAVNSPSFVLNIDSDLLRTELLVVDECSMVGELMARDLMHFGCKILVLGDPAQLPPVKGTGFFTNHKPNTLLTEIHRQAADNPIIKLATDVRQGRELIPGNYGESKVVESIGEEDALAADQILVGRNLTRKKTNRRMRGLLGYEGIAPHPGEKLVCLRNNHELGLLNGSMWTVTELYDDDDPISMSVSPEGEKWSQDVLAHRGHFDGKGVAMGTWREAEEFCSGYALTVHKSQGSQWNNVLLLDESWAFRQNARRHLYTGITRAAEKVTIKI